MAKKMKFIFAFTLLILFTGMFLVGKVYCGGQNKPMNQKSHEEDMINVYKKGKEIKVTPASIYFLTLKDAIVNFTSNIDNGYELIPSNDRIDSYKKGGYAIELIYALPKQLPITFLKKAILIKRIFIPLKGSDFPHDSVFIYEYQHEDFPYTLANTKQKKTILLKIIEPLN